MIRRATMDDIGGIVALGCTFYYRSAWAKRFGYFQTHKAQMALAQAIAQPASWLVMVSDRDGMIDGFVVAGVFESQFAGSDYVSDVALISTGGRGLSLLRAMVRWAQEKKLPLIVATSFGDDKAEKIYTRAGLSRVGALFMG
jgi:L-amino acid N-acyltransferase YncA